MTAAAVVPMFPLGAVLVPHAVLPLHIFEPRYRVLMFDITHSETTGLQPEFGVVLIERGSEVGGEDSRFSIGTLARVVQAGELPDGRWVLRAVGTRRFRVGTWLDPDPYPRAEIVELPEQPWEETDAAALAGAEAAVRELLRLGTRLGGESAGFARPDIELAADPAVASWQLVALSPLASIDRQRLLECEQRRIRLEQLTSLTTEATAMLAYRLEGGQS